MHFYLPTLFLGLLAIPNCFKRGLRLHHHLSRTRTRVLIKNLQISLTFYLSFSIKLLTFYVMSQKSCLHAWINFHPLMLILGPFVMPNRCQAGPEPPCHLLSTRFCPWMLILYLLTWSAYETTCYLLWSSFQLLIQNLQVSFILYISFFSKLLTQKLPHKKFVCI